MVVITRAMETSRLRRENVQLRRKEVAAAEMLGHSAPFRRLRDNLDKVARSNGRVMLTGEPGTGKELAARYIHAHSPRADAPFVTVPCATIEPERMEEVLFGRETPERGIEPGLLEQAHGGVIYFDEVADMPRETQNRILRVLVDQNFQRVGGTTRVHVDVRIISSSSRDLPAEIALPAGARAVAVTFARDWTVVVTEAGEVLVRRRLRRSSDGLPVPLQLQVLEADFLDATKSGALGAGRLVQGIEFDPVGKRRAYWLHAEHPGDAYGALQNGLQSRPVPATEIAHVYEKQRTQARGVPWGAPVIRSLRDLDDYEVAELVRKKTEACVTAIVFGDDEAQQGIAPSVVDADGNRVEQFEPGLIAYARGGKDIRFNQPSATGGYGEYKRASLHTISAGFRVPYELLTGDLSQVNYSSIRAGLVEFRRQIDAVQWQLFIPMFCAPVWRWFTEAAWAAGQIPSPIVPVEWSPPKFEAVDPQKDAMANLLSIRSGTMTPAEVIARQGRNPDAVLAEIAATNAKLDALGLVLDSDPRRVTKTGSAQTGDPATDPADAESDTDDPAANADNDPAQADQQD